MPESGILPGRPEMKGNLAPMMEEAATAQLRFKSGALQQLWRIIQWKEGVIYSHTTEWRDVPSAPDGD